jgi:hypothetical protein
VCVQTNGGWRQEVCQVNHRGAFPSLWEP